MMTFLAFLCALLISFALTAALRAAASKWGSFMDIPDNGRRSHKEPTPLLGGIAVYIAFAVATAVFGHADSALTYILCGLPIVICGVLDDIFSVKPIYKIIAQIAAGVILCLRGISVSHMDVFGNDISLGWFNYVITVAWVIGVTNAFNLIDGLNGLCTGLAAIMSAGLAIIAVTSGNAPLGGCALVFMGACLGFFPHNAYNAKIFLGDTGSMLIGFIMSSMTVELSYSAGTDVSAFVPLILLGIPIFDTLYAIVRRLHNGTSVFMGDDKHIHHILRAKFGAFKAMILLCLAAAVCALIAFVTTLGLAGEIAGCALGAVILIWGFLRFGMLLGKKDGDSEKN